MVVASCAAGAAAVGAASGTAVAAGAAGAAVAASAAGAAVAAGAAGVVGAVLPQAARTTDSINAVKSGSADMRERMGLLLTERQQRLWTEDDRRWTKDECADQRSLLDRRRAHSMHEQSAICNSCGPGESAITLLLCSALISAR